MVSSDDALRESILNSSLKQAGSPPPQVNLPVNTSAVCIGGLIAAGGLIVGLRRGGWLPLAIGLATVYCGMTRHCSLGDLDCQESRSRRHVDVIDEAAMESFPASDPPSYSGSPKPKLAKT